MAKTQKDWDSPQVKRDNLEDLLIWATSKLKKMDIHPKGPSEPKIFSNKQNALSYLFFSKPNIRKKVEFIRREFWNLESPPFPSREIGEPMALEEAGEWLEEKYRIETQEADKRKHHVKLILVFESDISIDQDRTI